MTSTPSTLPARHSLQTNSDGGCESDRFPAPPLDFTVRATDALDWAENHPTLDSAADLARLLATRPAQRRRLALPVALAMAAGVVAWAIGWGCHA